MNSYLITIIFSLLSLFIGFCYGGHLMNRWWRELKEIEDEIEKLTLQKYVAELEYQLERLKELGGQHE